MSTRLPKNPLPETTLAVAISAPGAPEVLRPEYRLLPRPGTEEVLIQARAAGVNRPDLLQRKGNYAPPPGAADLPGLEVAGKLCSLARG